MPHLLGGQQLLQSVTLVSLLDQSSLCPNENVAIFSCTVVGSNTLKWRITGFPQVDSPIILSFNSGNSPGKIKAAKSDQITAHLLSNNSIGKQSALLVRRLNSTSFISIECNGHNISYYPFSRGWLNFS